MLDILLNNEDAVINERQDSYPYWEHSGGSLN